MFKSILDPFITFDKSKDQPKQPVKKSDSVSEATVKQPVASDLSSELTGATLDHNTYEVLTKSLKEAKQSGFCYLDFISSLSNEVFKTIPEQARFQAVFAVAASSGLTKQKLLDSVAHYRKVLITQKNNFDNHVSEVELKKIENKRISLANDNQKIVELQEEIVNITKMIQTLQEKCQKSNFEIEEYDTKIKSINAKFNTCINSLNKDLAENENKINTYLV